MVDLIPSQTLKCCTAYTDAQIRQLAPICVRMVRSQSLLTSVVATHEKINYFTFRKFNRDDSGIDADYMTRCLRGRSSIVNIIDIEAMVFNEANGQKTSPFMSSRPQTDPSTIFIMIIRLQGMTAIEVVLSIHAPMGYFSR